VKRMQYSIGLVILALMMVNCAESKSTSASTDAASQARESGVFALDGLHFGSHYLDVVKELESRRFVEVDRMVFDATEEIHSIADLMVTYVGNFYGQQAEVGFHFKDGIFKFLAMHVTRTGVEPLAQEFTRHYGLPSVAGDLVNGEAFQGDNTLWRVMHEEQQVGYVSLIGIEGAGDDPDELVARITIYPFSANPPTTES
jgi:hypothetical protein